MGVTSEVGGATPVKGAQELEGSVDLEVESSFGHVGNASLSLSFDGIGPRVSLSATFRAEELKEL